MTNRERLLAALRYQSVDRMPVVHFGFWGATLLKWAAEGHISLTDAKTATDSSASELRITRALGFDFNYATTVNADHHPDPPFAVEVMRVLPDGSRHVRNALGVVVLEKTDVTSIPAEIEHLLTDRAGWVEHYRDRMRWSPARVDTASVLVDGEPPVPFEPRGRLRLSRSRNDPVGLYVGSLWGTMRDIVGLENLSYLLADAEDLVDEMVETFAVLAEKNAAHALATDARFDFAHLWEDICYRSGPLFSPATFRAKAASRYRRITDVTTRHGVDLVSLDCDGMIDQLIPVWLDNGVNVMFPIEVGTWGASIGPWRARFGRELRGVGGVDKRVFARDRKAVDHEIERLRPLVDMGGYVPCVDHRIPPDAQWDLVSYYAERFRAVFG